MILGLPRAPHLRAATLIVGAVLAAAIPTSATAETTNNTSEKLRAAVTPDGVMDHLRALDAIGSAHGGTRASGTSGFAASREYVVSQLEAAGYHPVLQEFDFAFFRELTPPELDRTAPTATTYTTPAEFATMTYSGSGEVTALVQAVDVMLPPGPTASSSTSGCEAADFAGFTAGNIALLQRGTCTFAVKAQNAEAAGASAAIVFNEGQPGRTATVAGTLGAPGIAIPVLGTSFAIGEEWATTPGTTLHVKTLTESEIRQTWNIFAETASGNPDNVVMVGAHLDSVIAGPGVNDDGSGVASVLEVAQQLAKVKPINKVRFAWWGAEELGLLGSTHYVSGLSAAELEDIALYLNFDMVASPNYALMVYDGNNSAFPAAPPGVLPGDAGSAVIEDLFHDYYAGQGLPSSQTPLSGRSDYRAFLDQGIPIGGVFTGAEATKSAAQQAAFGGTAGVAFDVCYHQACDTLANVSVQALDYNSDAIAHAVLTYAFDTRSVNGQGKGHPVSDPDDHVDGTPIEGGAAGGGGLHDDEHELVS